MTDLGRALRGALDGETTNAVAPPFDGLLRLHRHRRARRTMTAATAAVLVAGGVAVAVPRHEARLRPAATPSPSLKPLGSLVSDPDPAAERAIGACMEARGYPVPREGLWLVHAPVSYSDGDPKLRAFPKTYDDCAAASGYDAGQVASLEANRALERRYVACHAFEQRLGETTVVGSGTFRGTPWAVRGVAVPGGFCLLKTWAGKTSGGYPGTNVPTGITPGPSLSDSLDGPTFVFMGGIDAAAVSFDAVVDGVPVGTFRTVAVPGVEGRVFYAFVARLANQNHFVYRVTAHDADGNVVGPSRDIEILPRH
jgi:hypothetical protein